MEYISFEKLKYYIDKVAIKVVINGAQYSFAPEHNISVDFDYNPPKSETTLVGIHVNDEVYKTIDSVFENIKIDSDIQLIEISSYNNLKEFEDELFINSCTEEELLKFYNECNVFSLTLPCCFGANPNEKEYEQAYSNYVIKCTDRLKELYQKYKTPEMPSFNELYDEIKNECIEFGNKHKNDEMFYYSFISDCVRKKETKYVEPMDLFWHFYDQVGRIIDYKNDFSKYKDKEHFDALEFLKFNNILKNNYIKHEFTYTSLVTEGSLQVILYFKINDETKEFLVNQYLKQGYDNNHLEDLALYINEKPKYASCTHEGFCYNID